MGGSGEHADSSASSGTVAKKQTRARPDAWPSRLVMGAGAVAALTVISAGLVHFPVPAADAATPGQTEVGAPADAGARAKTKVKRPVRYVRLKRGQKAPRGAKVIQEAAPAPRVVVRYVSAPAAKTSRTPAARRPVTRTRQSGG